MSTLQGWATIIGSHLTRKPTVSPVLTKCWNWELRLATNFGSYAQMVIEFGGQNLATKFGFVPDCWSQVLSREWRCSWSSADRRCFNYIWACWVTSNVIAYWAASYIRCLTIFFSKYARGGGGGGGGTRPENWWGCATGHWKLDPKRSRKNLKFGAQKRSIFVKIGSFCTPKDSFAVGGWEKYPKKIVLDPAKVKKGGQNRGTYVSPIT